MIYDRAEEVIRDRYKAINSLLDGRPITKEDHDRLSIQLECLGDALNVIRHNKISLNRQEQEFSDLINGIADEMAKEALKKIMDFFDKNPMLLYDRPEITKSQVKYVFVINKDTWSVKKIDLEQLLKPEENEAIVILQENRTEEKGS